MLLTTWRRLQIGGFYPPQIVEGNVEVVQIISLERLQQC